MVPAMELMVGEESWRLMVAASQAVQLHQQPYTPTDRTPAQLIQAALEHPYQFEPLRRALTPDDRVAIVIEPRLPHLAEMLAEVLRYLGRVGIPPQAVTVVSPPGSPDGWMRQLPVEFASITTEIHDPMDARKHAYLATTKAGRRLYLNRSVVEADFVILLTGRRFDPHTGYAGAEAAIFPALSNHETRAAFVGQFTTGHPQWVEGEAAEIAWLLGTPFFVQVIEDSGDRIHAVIAGLLASGAEGIRQQDARWRSTISREPDTVIAAIGGDPAGITFLDLAKAVATAARVVQAGGRIGLLTTAAPPLGPGAELLRRLDGPEAAKKSLAAEKPDDWAAAALWAFAARRASLFLASGYPDHVAEELFATPIHTPQQVQRLIDSSQYVLLLPDAHKTTVSLR
ncbi:MAG: lactate racemase domain-containing protein [Gemmataceae bacterium]|nr:lactate racemase domain-containing protein [Gemmata sp.]MDW8198364.1 lactate racemase domain-containing protein [Gemmataceae bacterium]